MEGPNIWIIQKDFEKLKIALSTIDKASSNNFLYTNCISHFNCDNVTMSSKNFDSFLYCQDSDTYIIFMKDNLDKIDYTRKYLNNSNITYHEITFKNEKEDVINRFPNSLHSYEKNSKEIWIVNSEESLMLLINKFVPKDSITFYPLLNSEIKLSYSNNRDKEIGINNFYFEGAIVIDNKLILIRSNKNKDIIDIPVKAILSKLKIKFVTAKLCRPKFINTEEKRNQKFEQIYSAEKTKSLAKMY